VKRLAAIFVVKYEPGEKCTFAGDHFGTVSPEPHHHIQTMARTLEEASEALAAIHAQFGRTHGEPDEIVTYGSAIATDPLLQSALISAANLIDPEGTGNA